MNTTVRWETYTPHFFGLEETFRRLDAFADSNSVSYPPYNIIRLDKDRQQLQIALAGFDKEDIEVAVQKKVLNISVQKVKEEADIAFVHKGISSRSFNRNWQLSDDTVIDEVSFVNGLLCVTLKQEIPEEDRRKVFDIS